MSHNITSNSGQLEVRWSVCTVCWSAGLYQVDYVMQCPASHSMHLIGRSRSAVQITDNASLV